MEVVPTLMVARRALRRETGPARHALFNYFPNESRQSAKPNCSRRGERTHRLWQLILS